MSITNFTVNFDLFASQTDSSDSGIDADIVPLIGTVTFTPLTTDNRPVLAPTYSPRPAGFKLLPFTGYLDIDGRLKSERSGANGVRLWANDPVLKLNSLNYKVEFDLRTPVGQKVKVDPGYFTAPNTDVSIQLAEVLQATGTVSTSTLLPQGPKGDRGYGIVGLAPALDGTYVQALVESDAGPIAVGTPFLPSNSYNSTVTHGNNASYARPAVSVAVIWIGSVQPTNAIDGDVWMDTSGTAPTIVTTVIGGLNIGLATNQTLAASGSTPIVWSLDSGTLPAGLTLSTAGTIFGTPTTSGSYSFTAKAANGFGSATRTYTGTTGSAVAPTINTSLLGTLTAGLAASVTVSTTGSASITFAVQAGSLPTGLSLNTSTGVISGTPSAAGSYSFTIRATNSVGYADQAFTGTVTGIAPTITSTSLGTPYRAFAFSQTIAVTGTSPITFAVQSGTLPAGLTLNSTTGVISGTPTTVASSTFSIRATNSYGTNDKSFTVAVLESTPNIVETSLNAIALATTFTQTLTLSAGGPTITWSINTGSLPTGLTLNASTGTISGTPSAAGSYSVTIRASNGSAYDDQAFTGSITSPIAFDAVGSGGANSTLTTTPVTGTHSATSGATALVYCLYVSTTNSTTLMSVSYGGTAMTQVGSTLSLGSSALGGTTYYSFATLFKLANVSSGSKTISATPGANSVVQFESVSYTGVSTVGSLQTVSTTSLSASQTVTSASGHFVSQAFIKPGVYAGASSYNQTTRANKTSGTPYRVLCVGDASGAASVTFTATVPSGSPDVTGGLAVDLAG